MQIRNGLFSEPRINNIFLQHDIVEIGRPWQKPIGGSTQIEIMWMQLKKNNELIKIGQVWVVHQLNKQNGDLLYEPLQFLER